MVDVVRTRRGSAAVPDLPGGHAWLMVEVAGDDLAEVRDRSARLVAAAQAMDSLIVEDTAVAAPLWRIREDGAGLAGRAPSGKPAYPGWEDAAVPPAKIGAYLRDFDALVEQHGLSAMPYGHLGDGCVHVRLDFPLRQAGRPGNSSAPSSKTPPTWWSATAGRCPASTGTAGPAASCCRGCTRRPR